MTTFSSRDLVWIRRRAMATGVPSEITAPIVDLFVNWGENSGLEWAISRFKSIKNDFLRMKAGLTPVSTWIKSSRNPQRKFGGPVGALEGFAAKGESSFAAALSLLNIYTNFYAPGPTRNQAKKFLTAVNAPLIPVPEAVKRKVVKAIRVAKIKPFKKLNEAQPLLAYLPSETKWAPTPFGRMPEENGVVDSVGFILTPQGRKHYLKYQKYYRPVLRGLEKEVLLGRNFIRPSHLTAMVVGRIGLIQEAGYKLRAVANPGRIFQQVLSPLGDKLFGLLKGLPWDCTFDQSKADSYLLRATSDSSRSIFSVDLSNATDFFPLDLQLEVLNVLFPHDTGLVDLFAEVSRSFWECTLPAEYLVESGFSTPGYVRWSKGQPLGLYPSFASFALTHGLLLLGLLGREWDGDFFILGDDVVILNEQLYTDYIHVMDVLGCPTSSQKSISAPNLAEFHSTLFVSGSKIPNFKWRKPSDDSFLDLTKLVGPRLVPLLPPRQRMVVEALAPLPAELGGLGWNPKGLSLDERLSPWIPYLIRDKAGLEYLTDYSRYTSKALWQSKLAIASREIELSVETDDSFFVTFDQKVKNLVQSTFGISLVPMSSLLGLNLGEVLDSNVDLPIPGVRRFRRVTTLQKYESVIKTLSVVPKPVNDGS